LLPFEGKLAGDNRWIKLAELIPWDDLEDDLQPSSATGLVLQQSPSVVAELRTQRSRFIVDKWS
jgi:hypothetical protein